MSKKNIGSGFDDFLQEESLLESSTAVALKRVIAWQIDQEMKAQKLTKTELAKRMHTNHAALNRLLDENDASLTLTQAHNMLTHGDRIYEHLMEQVSLDLIRFSRLRTMHFWRRALKRYGHASNLRQ